MLCNFTQQNEFYICLNCGVIRPVRVVQECEIDPLADRFTQSVLRSTGQTRVGSLLCKHLGAPIEKNGIIEKVKCSCKKTPNEKGYRELFHTEHTCNAPAHQRTSGKPGRCLPTFPGPFDKDHQLEAKLYHLCQGCPHKSHSTNKRN